MQEYVQFDKRGCCISPLFNSLLKITDIWSVQFELLFLDQKIQELNKNSNAVFISFQYAFLSLTG